VIISRTPLRISLGGGGTDLPSYYRESGGFLVAAAITQYVYVSVNRNFEPDIMLKYSSIERRSDLGEVEHPLLRECLRSTGITEHVEITSMADIPAGTGLGSSGSFAVGALKAMSAYRRSFATNLDLAHEACRIEIEELGEPVGKQDQYIAAIGGLTGLEFHRDGKVEIHPVEMDPLVRDELEEHLLLFYTGVRRSASEVLWDQNPTVDSSADLRANLDHVKELGRETVDSLVGGDLDRFGRSLTHQWRAKYERSPSEIHDQIDGLIQTGIDAGASGGKLVGAGGGGFLLFYAPDKTKLRAAMADEDLAEVRFRFDDEGSTIIVT
jgi:D-glycero-alpha-D-manno-heptose-7-phosphate kinase